MLGHFVLAFVILLNLYKKKQPIINSYTLHDQQLEHVTTAKYLGVSITSDMKWNQHISNICKKANNTMNFLIKTKPKYQKCKHKREGLQVIG
jgi:hypothetical protein